MTASARVVPPTVRADSHNQPGYGAPVLPPSLRTIPRFKTLTDQTAALVAVVPKDKLTIKGPIKKWTGKGSSGKDVHRLFCSECGSPIAHDPDAAPEIIALKAGTLDSELKKNLKPVSYSLAPQFMVLL